MNFTSQICTTKEQSERLFALGLKKKTTDMVLQKNRFGEWLPSTIIECPFNDYIFLAWSLHRLIEMMPSTLQDLYELDFSKRGVYYADFSNGSFDFIQSFAKPNKTLYDNVINCIEWLIKEGYFNKEYLEE